MYLWVYIPKDASSDQTRPCVLIAPAGSNLLTGNRLGPGSENEHIPYVKAGYVVIAYDLDGDCTENATDAAFAGSIRQYRDARCGLTNAEHALEYALKRVPEVDPQHIYVAGHSSAGTVALDFAANEPRINAAIAYAPVTDILAWQSSIAMALAERMVRGTKDMAKNSSPINNASSIRCPVFIFHADDDSNVKRPMIQEFVTKLQKTNPNVQFSTVPSGDHYDSMINSGISQAITWLNSRYTPPPIIAKSSTPSPGPTQIYVSPPVRQPDFPPPTEYVPPSNPNPTRTESAEPRPQIIVRMQEPIENYTIPAPKGFVADNDVPPNTRLWTRKAPGRAISSIYRVTIDPGSASPRLFGANPNAPTLKAGNITFTQISISSDQKQRVAKWEAIDGKNRITIDATCDAFDPDAGDAMKIAVMKIARSAKPAETPE